MVFRFLFAAIALLVWSSPGLAQYDSWTITIATGDTISLCSLQSFDGDSLHIIWSGFPVSLPIESIFELRYHKRSEFLHGAIIGSSIGGMTGTLSNGLGSSAGTSGLQSSIIGITGGFLIGGLAGEYFSRDERYGFLGMDKAEKAAIMNTLVSHRRLSRQQLGR